VIIDNGDVSQVTVTICCPLGVVCAVWRETVTVGLPLIVWLAFGALFNSFEFELRENKKRKEKKGYIYYMSLSFWIKKYLLTTHSMEVIYILFYKLYRYIDMHALTRRSLSTYSNFAHFCFRRLTFGESSWDSSEARDCGVDLFVPLSLEGIGAFFLLLFLVGAFFGDFDTLRPFLEDREVE
jgi:hypothetical protein